MLKVPAGQERHVQIEYGSGLDVSAIDISKPSWRINSLRRISDCRDLVLSKSILGDKLVAFYYRCRNASRLDSLSDGMRVPPCGRRAPAGDRLETLVLSSQGRDCSDHTAIVLITRRDRLRVRMSNHDADASARPTPPASASHRARFLCGFPTTLSAFPWIEP